MASDNPTNISSLLDPRVFGAPSTVSQVLAGTYSGGGSSSSSSGQLAQVLQQLESVAKAETETIQANTLAINQNTTELGQRGTSGSTVGQTGSTIESALGLATGLSPLITGVVGLFSGLLGGGGNQESVPGPFLMAPSVNVNAGLSEAAPTQPFAVDYAPGGAPRGATASPGSGAQVTVQVQAMDSQSFLDHSGDIANAVRQAMLESNVLNDVIREV